MMEFGADLMQLGVKTVVVEAWGEMDISAAAEFDGCVDTALGGETAEIVLDLRRVTFADSSAANRIGVAACRAVVEGRRLIVRPSQCLRRVLILTGTARLVVLEEDAHAEETSV
jgi:anti-anti-sigma factor